MAVNEAYLVTKFHENKIPQKEIQKDRVYTYDEAIDLAGNGSYNIALLTTLSVATLSMAVDIFGFSVVVSGASCEFNLGIRETSILLSVTFIGPILMAYPWGYISDTQGRRTSLIISLWTSFLISSASAFSPNWITMAVLKWISTSFSACAQSTTYTLLGESCSHRFRDSYIIIMASVLDISLAIYVVIAYFVLNLDFAYDFGFVSFTPWRLLALILATISGLGAFGVLFFYESPKFLLNMQRHDEAVAALAGIWRRNGRKKEYPVQKVFLNEEGNDILKASPIWHSLWKQVVPIFQPPLLWRSLQLYFLTVVLYGINSSYFIWLPYLGEQFIKNKNSNNTNQYTTVCSLIASDNKTFENPYNCSYEVDISLVWFSLIQGVSFVLMTAGIATIAHRKRFLIITVFLVCSLCGIGTVLVENMTASFLMFLGVLANQLVIGVICSYYVELYPTSYRCMATCLGSMVARSSALVCVGLFGSLLTTDCPSSFLLSSGLMIGAALVATLLPKDKNRPKL